MNIAIEFLLVIVICFLGINIGNIYKRNRFIRNFFQDENALNIGVEGMAKQGFFNKKASEISISGRLYSNNYMVNISNEIESSRIALNKARNILFIIMVIILAISYFIGYIYLIINFLLFLISF